MKFRLEIGLDDVRLHDLRHNYASFAARKSETLPMIGKLLGHSAINSTQRYAHLDDVTLLRSVERIGGVIASPTHISSSSNFVRIAATTRSFKDSKGERQQETERAEKRLMSAKGAKADIGRSSYCRY